MSHIYTFFYSEFLKHIFFCGCLNISRIQGKSISRFLLLFCVCSPGEYEIYLTESSAFLFYGMERFMCYVPPHKIAAMNLPSKAVFTDMQSLKTVTAYLTSEQLLPFRLAKQITPFSYLTVSHSLFYT